MAKEIVDAVSSVYPYYASFENLEQDAGSQCAYTAQEAGTVGACVSIWVVITESAQALEYQSF